MNGTALVPDAPRPDSPKLRLQIIGHVARCVNQCREANLRLGEEPRGGSRYEAMSSLGNASAALMLACAKLRRMHPATGHGDVLDSMLPDVVDVAIAKLFLDRLDIIFLDSICEIVARTNDLAVANRLERVAASLGSIRSWLDDSDRIL